MLGKWYILNLPSPFVRKRNLSKVFRHTKVAMKLREIEPGSKYWPNFSGVTALTAVKISHRSRY